MSRDEVKRVLAWLSEEENRESLELVFRQLRYLLKHGRFRKLCGLVRFGLSDPYMMGRLLSLLSIFYPVYGKELALYPVFEEDCFSGDLHIRGYIRLWHVLVAAVKLFMNRQLRSIILGGDKNDGEQQCEEPD